MSSFRKIIDHPLTKNFFVYSFGALFLKGVSFILLPLYTSLLSPEEYGILDLLSTFTSVLDISLSLGLISALMIEYFHYNDQQRKKIFDALISIYLSLSLLLYIIVVGVVMFFRENLFTSTPSLLILLSGLTAYLTFFQTFTITILKQREEANRATVLQIGSGIISIGLNVLFVYGWSWGVAGIIWSSFIGVLLFSGYSFYFIIKELGFKYVFDRERYMYFLKLGLPFVPSGVMLWLMTSANRWILLTYTDLEQVGFYSVAFKFSSLFEPLIIAPFLSAYTPRIMKRFQSGDYTQELYKFILGGIPAFIAMGFALQLLASWMIDDQFDPALILIPMLVFNAYFSLMAQVCAYILVYRKKVLAMLSAITGAAIIGVATNFLLVPAYGAVGSAIAYNISGLTWLLWIYFLQKRERVNLKQHGH
jgi:O-antigen/teichoic acid export membrane protein